MAQLEDAFGKLHKRSKRSLRSAPAVPAERHEDSPHGTLIPSPIRPTASLGLTPRWSRAGNSRSARARTYRWGTILVDKSLGPVAQHGRVDNLRASLVWNHSGNELPIYVRRSQISLGTLISDGLTVARGKHQMRWKRTKPNLLFVALPT